MDLGGILNKGEEKVFLISSTHGGETNAIRAGLKTIEEFKDNNVIDHIYATGDELIKKTKALIEEKKLTRFIEIIPCPWMVSFVFKNKEGEICNIHRTYFMKRMIENNVLFQGIFVPTLSHRKNEIDAFIKAFNSSLKDCNKMFDYGFEKKLKEKPILNVFRKYN